jgi:hypothetical protein
MKKILSKLLIVLLVLFVLIQFIQYGRDHDNPPVTNQVSWDNDFTKETFYNACADCHSNETKWPWYSNIAPVSWLVQSDVDEGREHFNISTFDGMEEANEAYEMVEEGEMPLGIYLPLHPEANLDEKQKAKFIEGLKATFNKPSSENIKENEEQAKEE